MGFGSVLLGTAVFSMLAATVTAIMGKTKSKEKQRNHLIWFKGWLCVAIVCLVWFTIRAMTILVG